MKRLPAAEAEAAKAAERAARAAAGAGGSAKHFASRSKPEQAALRIVQKENAGEWRPGRPWQAPTPARRAATTSGAP